MITYELMSDQYVAQVAALEAVCFSAPWSEHAVAGELTNPLSLWLVAIDGEKVVGYIGSQSVMGEADMMNIAVLPEYRRQRIGQSLVNRLITQLQLKQVHCLSLEVRISNESAKKMYEKLGFQQVGRRPNYYSAPKEDALILRKEW